MPTCFFHKPCVTVQWVERNRTKYRLEMCVVIHINEDEICPFFGIIKKIIINHMGEVCLVCLKINCYGYDNEIGAYELQNYNSKDELQCILIQNLVSPFPTIKAKLSNGKMFAGLKILL